MSDTLEHQLLQLTRNGFVEIEQAPRNPLIRAGARVHNRGEQFDRAFTEGTATVVKVLRRGTDEKPDSWERRYGRPNVEVVVQRDDGMFMSWADYGTEVVEAGGSES